MGLARLSEPPDVGLVPEPGHLPLREAQRRRDDRALGVLDRHLAAQHRQGLPVADRLERSREGVEAPGRARPRTSSISPRSSISPGAGLDGRPQRRPARVEPDDEGPIAAQRLGASPLLLRDGAARRAVDLEGPHDAHTVPRADPLRRHRVDPPEQAVQPLVAEAVAERLETAAQRLVARGPLEQAHEQRPQVQAGASGHDRKPPARPDARPGRRGRDARSRQPRTPRRGRPRRAGGARPRPAPRVVALALPTSRPRYTCRLSQETISPERSRARRRARALLPEAVGPTIATRGAATAATGPAGGWPRAGSPPRGPAAASARSPRRAQVAHDRALVVGAERPLDREQLRVEQLVERVHEGGAPPAPRPGAPGCAPPPPRRASRPCAAARPARTSGRDSRTVFRYFASTFSAMGPTSFTM